MNSVGLHDTAVCCKYLICTEYSDTEVPVVASTGPQPPADACQLTLLDGKLSSKSFSYEVMSSTNPLLT